jgi:hypothetical protein
LYAREAPEVLNRIGISFVMVGAANSDSARISFFGSMKGELAQKLDRGKDAVRCRRLIQVPPKPREMVAYYTAHKLCLGWGYLLFVGGTYGARRASVCCVDCLCISYRV